MGEGLRPGVVCFSKRSNIAPGQQTVSGLERTGWAETQLRNEPVSNTCQLEVIGSDLSWSYPCRPPQHMNSIQRLLTQHCPFFQLFSRLCFLEWALRWWACVLVCAWFPYFGNCWGMGYPRFFVILAIVMARICARNPILPIGHDAGRNFLCESDQSRL